MIKRKSKYKVKGFTIAELLVVLVLSSISISLSYGTLTYIQKLFSEYKKQNKFLNEYTDLKERLDYESLNARIVELEKENCFLFHRDSTISSLQLLEHKILLKRNNHCDTFHIEPQKIKVEFEHMTNPIWVNRLVNKISFEGEYTKQKLTICFYKDHSSAIKLMLDKEEKLWQ
ncbi:prepilin-type N-terminal cleavage/methylation domain-containing protein [Aurantibacillus circumpalustris]|uniref:prepilin-type N-terminal cleavage/methylation domain-containing protein n=1 Tax=Aurantibacillus circumpalustris TaxID=3036359 RepID=UPI00295A7DAA|nr:prepilin-type N-terminal cleavage/methylation domain-containing protein [Aurantibacillus circumpalustris]